jgi:hypothetical protein
MIFLSMISVASAVVVNLHSDFTGRGLSVVDNEHIYITCVENECDNAGLGTNISILRWNDLGNSISRNDLVFGGTRLPILNQLQGDTLADNAQMFGSTGYYIVPYVITNVNDYTKILLYTWSPTTNSFGLSYNFTSASHGALFADNNQQAIVYSYDALGSTLHPDNNYFTAIYDDGVLVHVEPFTYQKTGSNTVNEINTLTNCILMNNMNPQSSNNNYCITYGSGMVNKLLYNGSKIGNGTAISGYGYYDETNDYYYVITDDRKNIYRGTLSGLINNNTAPNALSITPSCSVMLNQADEKIHDIDCYSSTDCVFVGTLFNQSLLIKYDGTDCFYSTPEMEEAGYNVSGKPLYNVEYLAQQGRYYITGQDIFAKFTTAFIYEDTSSYPYSLCVPNSNVATLSECVMTSNGTINCYNNGTKLYGVCARPSLYNPSNQSINNSAFVTNQDVISWFCNIDYVQSCTLGCANTPIGNGYYSAQCVNTPTTICTNDEGCTLDGLQECDGTTTVRRCVYSNPANNGDGCLHWQTSTTCAYGEICYAGQCRPEPLTNNSINYPAFTTSVYVPPSQTSQFVVNYNSRIVTRNSNDLVSGLAFVISTAQSGTYTGLSCNYNEVSVYNSTTSIMSNSTLNYTQTLNAPIVNSDFKLGFNINPVHTGSNGTAKIFIDDSLGNNIVQLFMERNDLDNRVCVYLSNSTEDKLSEVYCITDTSTYYGNYMTMTLLWNNKRFTTTMSQYIINRYSGSLNWNTLNALNIAQLRIVAGENSTPVISNVSMRMVSGLPTFSSTIVQSTNQYICSYTSNGCRIARIFVSPTNSLLYDNYQDWTVCINQQYIPPQGNTTTGGTFDQNTQSFVDSLFGTGLSTGEKLFYAIVGTFLALIITIIAGIYSGMPPALTGGLSVIVVLASLILFAFLGFIPVWIIILLAIIGAGVVAMLFKGMVAT